MSTARAPRSHGLLEPPAMAILDSPWMVRPSSRTLLGFLRTQSSNERGFFVKKTNTRLAVAVVGLCVLMLCDRRMD